MVVPSACEVFPKACDLPSEWAAELYAPLVYTIYSVSPVRAVSDKVVSVVKFNVIVSFARDIVADTIFFPSSFCDARILFPIIVDTILSSPQDSVNVFKSNVAVYDVVFALPTG